MKKSLSIILFMTMFFALSTPAFAAESFEDQPLQISEGLGSLNMASTKTEYKLEKEKFPNISSTTIKIEMDEDTSEEQLVADDDIAYAETTISVFNKNTISAEIFLRSYTGVFFTKVEGTTRLYVNGKYITSEDFKADPLIPVPVLQAATLLEYSDGLKNGDSVTVYFDGSFDTSGHGSRDIYQSVNLTVSGL